MCRRKYGCKYEAVYCKKYRSFTWDQNVFIFESCVVHPFMSRDQNGGRSHNKKIVNSSFTRLEQLKYLGTNLKNQNCYHSVQNLTSARMKKKNIKIRIYRNKILPVVLYGFETWSFTLKEERRLTLILLTWSKW
jgi:hypothetical protein